MRQSLGQKTGGKTKVSIEAKSNFAAYVASPSLVEELDDDQSDFHDELEELRAQEEEQEVDADLNDEYDDERYGVDDNPDVDPLHISESLDSYCRPVWLWVGGRLIWCHHGRGGDPYKEGFGEGLRRLVEWSTSHVWNYFSWMERPESSPSPKDASGIFPMWWIGKNQAQGWNRMAIMAPGSDAPLMTVASFFGSYKGGGLPEIASWLWFRERWLKRWCDERNTDEKGFLELFEGRKKPVFWKEGGKGDIDGKGMYDDHRKMLKVSLMNFVRKGLGEAGFSLDPKADLFTLFKCGKAKDPLKDFSGNVFGNWKKRLEVEVYGEEKKSS
ncbi:hypothetical protein [Dethiosulfovibrio salsuginis]|uniref:Uncharacterized protein n=1 Tax=Dethiosulfovibrio salsuginis TaxID=561720 RepID=A0A1X7KVC0_9BACT|nr:hypothetical protein [Dethiosulfovibrio salsuginis]SMG45221.1 hypothetical protein SAMN06275492_13714 [Dethiosulfovibrio salsuginis]